MNNDIINLKEHKATLYKMNTRYFIILNDLSGSKIYLDSSKIGKTFVFENITINLLKTNIENKMLLTKTINSSNTQTTEIIYAARKKTRKSTETTECIATPKTLVKQTATPKKKRRRIGEMLIPFDHERKTLEKNNQEASRLSK